jgi:hypothetical protein
MDDGRFGPACHFERSEKSFPMHMVKISQSRYSFEMTEVEIILIVIKKSSWSVECCPGDGLESVTLYDHFDCSLSLTFPIIRSFRLHFDQAQCGRSTSENDRQLHYRWLSGAEASNSYKSPLLNPDPDRVNRFHASGKRCLTVPLSFFSTC